jgi:hypothetical protein
MKGNIKGFVHLYPAEDAVAGGVINTATVGLHRQHPS